MSERITAAEFARRKGVTAQTISKSISNGRIAKGEDGLIDWDSQSKAFEENRDLAAVRSQEQLSANLKNNSSMQAIRLHKEGYAARLAELEYNREIGKVVDKEKIQVAIFKFTRFVRDSLQTIPERVSAVCAAKIVEHLVKEMRGKVPEKYLEQFLSSIKMPDIEKITRASWVQESRAVLEEVARGPNTD